MGEIGRWFGGGTPSKANPRFWTGGRIPWVSPKDMKFDLISDAQDHITEDAVAQSAGRVDQDLKAVKPLHNIRSDYLALALKAFERDILHTCSKTGTTVQSLELPVFLRFQIPVAPLPEQRRIVAEIEKQFTRLEAGVAALRRVQANLKRYRAAVLKAACIGRLVPTEVRSKKAEGRSVETGEQLLKRILAERRRAWEGNAVSGDTAYKGTRAGDVGRVPSRGVRGRGQYKEPAAPDLSAVASAKAGTANLPPLPVGWTWASVDQLSSHITSGSRDWPQFYGKGDGTFILAQNVRPMRLDLSERQSVAAPQGNAETERTRVCVSDLLITIVGAKTGDVCRVPSELKDHFVCQSVSASPSSKKPSPENSKPMRKQPALNQKTRFILLLLDVVILFAASWFAFGRVFPAGDDKG